MCTLCSITTSSSASFFQSLCVHWCVAGLDWVDPHLLPLLSLISKSYQWLTEHPPPPPPPEGFKGDSSSRISFLGLVSSRTPDFSMSDTMKHPQVNNKLQNYGKSLPKQKTIRTCEKSRESLLHELKLPTCWAKVFVEESFLMEGLNQFLKIGPEAIFMEVCAHQKHSDKKRRISSQGTSRLSCGPVLPADCSFTPASCLSTTPTLSSSYNSRSRGQMSRCPVFRMWFIVNYLLKAGIGLLEISLNLEGGLGKHCKYRWGWGCKEGAARR